MLPLTRSISRGTITPTGTLLANAPVSVTSANCSGLGVRYSPRVVPSAVSGTLYRGAPDEVANDTAPVTPPGAAGWNVTGAVSRSPRCSVTGNETGAAAPPGVVSVTWPSRNWLRRR